MSFQEAVSDAFNKYVDFSGRSSRSAYWYWTLFAFLVFMVTYAICLAIGTLIPYYLVALALFLPGLAVFVRRMHDVGRSGWWYFIVLIPLIGAIVLIVWLVTASEGPNKYGAGPDGAAAAPAGAF